MGEPSTFDRATAQRLWRLLATSAARMRSDAALAVLDVVLVVAGYAAMLAARYDLAAPEAAWEGLWRFLPVLVGVHLTLNWLAGLYGHMWRQASIREARQVLLAGLGATFIVTGLLLQSERLIPLSVAIIGGGFATALLGLPRFQSRLFAFRRARPAGRRVLVVGAGDAASALVRDLQRSVGDEHTAFPVAIVDDDAHKLGRDLLGVPVLGTVDDLVRVADDVEAEVALLAIPSAPSSLVRRVADAAAQAGLPLKVLPSLRELVDGRVSLQDVRDVSIDDLLGRDQIETDLDAVRALLAGRRVLVTGGGGSIGSEIARQVAGFGPARLVLLDRDETHLFDAHAGVPGGTAEQILADIRDRERLFDVFAAVRPEVVFHAAAHKHVPLLESHPCEAVATNVVGTANVLAAAAEFGVERLVFISTDKAVNPRNVMGASKRLGEQLLLRKRPEGARWCAVRFGNVLGSRGSVVPTFMRQIQRGGPITLTDPSMTRFFMSVPEAVQLVLQASALAEGGDVFMLDMGEPVRIHDLATRMISLAGLRVGVDIELRVTGLRPGEKLTEELHAADESPEPTTHPKVIRLQPAVIDPAILDEGLRRLDLLARRRDDAGAREMLDHLACDTPQLIVLPEEVHIRHGH